MESTISKQMRFEAAHRLREHKGKCRNLHGHSYEVVVFVKGAINNEGMVADYALLKESLSRHINAMDHSVLVSTADVELSRMCKELQTREFIIPGETTAENIAAFLAARVKCAFPDNIVTVSVSETRSSDASVCL